MTTAQHTDLKDQTLHIRLAGVDAPEVSIIIHTVKATTGLLYVTTQLAHFGNPAQPYSSEALDWFVPSLSLSLPLTIDSTNKPSPSYVRLTRKINGKRVRVELYSKDRFGRIVRVNHPLSLHSNACNAACNAIN